METLAQIAPLIILIPAIGAFINFFWGAKMGEGASAIVGSTASALSFFVALGLLSYLTGNDFRPAVIDPPFLDGWLRMESIGLDISWQTRVDTLSVMMTLFVTFVGTLIHIYAAGYMHGDSRFPRFFAYLNMFLTFMLILVMANNYLMMFVGWEGVGLCSYLLISFWWDKPNGEGIKNSNAGRKAFIVNRIGDFGVLMAIFLMYWSFGTLDFFKPDELANPTAGQGHGEEHSEDADGTHEGEEDGHASAPIALVYAGEFMPATAQEDDHGETAEGEEAAHGEEESHGVARAFYSYEDSAIEMNQLGVFGQVARYIKADEEASVIVTEAETELNNARGLGSPSAISEAESALEVAREEADAVRPTFNIGSLSVNIETLLVLITLFLLLGATGKSAQIPLFVWLPDAMAGPTPVSALIHAATMVTAGVYMMVRSNFLFYNAELTSFIVALVGATTALVAGFIAMGQFDIKRVLAYSTVSQLGFMVAAVGLGAYVAALFHMITHAFFKALLFLGSGSVIHGMEHGHHHAHEHSHDSHDEHGHDHHDDHFDPQDMRNMGGLSKKMRLTYWTYLFGTIALAGIWPFAGFWSKDEILADAWHVGLEEGELKGFIVLGFLLTAAFFTAFYMWRQIEMVFHGEARTEAAKHAPESVRTMTTPLLVLAFFALFVGFINIPGGLGFPFQLALDNVFGLHMLGSFIEHSLYAPAYHVLSFNPLIAIIALSFGIGGILLARNIYGKRGALNAEGKDWLQADPDFAPIWGLANARLYWDDIYWALIINPYIRIADFLYNVLDWGFLHDYFHDSVILRGYRSVGQLLARPFDLGVIDGAVNGAGWLVTRASASLRRVQTGYVRTYAVALLLGVVAVIVLMLLPLI